MLCFASEEQIELHMVLMTSEHLITYTDGTSVYSGTSEHMKLEKYGVDMTLQVSISRQGTSMYQ